MPAPPLDPTLAAISARTVAHDQRSAEALRDCTADVSQDRAALLVAIEGAPPLRPLDLGRARAPTGCEVLHHDFLALDPPAAGFDELSPYNRPAGRPRGQQPWLATVWR